MKSMQEIKKIRCLRILEMHADGGCGIIRLHRYAASIIWSTGAGWDHVSICPYESLTPSWSEMVVVKDLFFRDDETVVQYHPPKNQYVNMVTNCMHLWRLQDGEMPVPPSILVGLRDEQTCDSAIEEMEEVMRK